MHPETLIGLEQTAIGAHVRPRTWEHSARLRATRPRYFIGEALLILLAGFILRMWNLGGASLWTDEVLTAIRAQAPLDNSLRSIFSAGNQTPFLLHVLRLLPVDSDMLLRSLGAVGHRRDRADHDRRGAPVHSYDLALASGLLLGEPVPRPALADSAPYALIFVLALVMSISFLLILRGNRSRVLWIAFTVSTCSPISRTTRCSRCRDAGDSVGDLRTERPRPADTLGGGAGDRRRAGTAVADAALQQTIAIGPEWCPCPRRATWC